MLPDSCHSWGPASAGGQRDLECCGYPPDPMKTPAKWILGLLLGAYLAGRVWILNISTTIEWWDTHSYAHRDNPAFNLGHLVSFTGRAPRLWGAPLFFHFFHTDQYRAEAQWAVSTFAWALLAWAVWRLLRTLLARVGACVAILGYALMTAVTEWDFTVLS